MSLLAIVWSVRDNDWNVEQKIELHKKKIKGKGESRWGVGFNITNKLLRFPLTGYMYVKGTGRAEYIARIGSVENHRQPDQSRKPCNVPLEFRHFRHKAFIALDELVRLENPIPISSFTKWDGDRVRGGPQKYTIVKAPDRTEEAKK